MKSPIAKTIRRTSLFLLSAGAVVALSGCALLPLPGSRGSDAPPPPDSDTSPTSDDDGSDAGLRNKPVPSDMPTFDESELPSEPGDSASPNDQIEWELVKFMNEFGMEYDPSSEATCDHTDGKTDETLDCTGTYGEQSVDFTVEVTGGETMFDYTYKAQELPISREAAEDGYRYHTDSEDVACDMDDYEVVNVGDTGVTCKAKTSTGMEEATIETSEHGGSFTYNTV